MAARALRGADGKLFVEAVGQQAFQLVASGDTTSPTVTVELNAKSRAIVERLLTRDVSLLLKALDRGSDSAEVAKQESGLLANRRETFGDFKSIDVLGTVPGPEGGLRTTVRINNARGGATNLYTWDRNGTIMDIGSRPYAPSELTMGDDGTLRILDAPAGSSAGGRARFSVSNGTLTIVTPKHTITLRRQ